MAEHRKCTKSGCRAWARRDSIFCQAHDPASGPGATKERANLHAHFMTKDEQELDPEGAGLDREIAAARVAVQLALAKSQPDVISRTVLAVGRLMEMKKRLERDQATGIVGAVAEVLAELGLDGSGPGAG